ncbi:hypothetical protein FBBAL38_11519 [Flavobacteria bacterium BAL38]|nr:hypothetical protein FBBAL38_11519 [Flavobacteria bacterium BAL38]
MYKTILLVILFCVSNSIFSQEILTAAGGNASGVAGSSSFSVGQVVYIYNTGTTGSVAEGVQHAFEIVTLSNPELTTLTLSAMLYPNPTTDLIVLSLRNSALSGLSYTLFHITGKAIANGKITAADTQIELGNLPSATYILKVNQNNKELKTFKIIKK